MTKIVSRLCSELTAFDDKLPFSVAVAAMHFCGCWVPDIISAVNSAEPPKPSGTKMVAVDESGLAVSKDC